MQSTIDIKQVKKASAEIPSAVQVDIPGEATKTLESPDREVMALIDAMLGQSSCLNNPSQCAFRCYYDPEAGLLLRNVN